MSSEHIDTLFNIWATFLNPHHDKEPPFNNHTELYNTIDSTPLGDVTEGERPAWMDAEYEVWYCNPKQLIKTMLACPDFANKFNYSPFQEYNADGNHHFQNLMSGNWAWKQVVCIIFIV